MLADLLDLFAYTLVPAIYKILFVASPIWVPWILGYIMVILYVRKVRMKYVAGNTPILLEIKLPKTIDKSPLAMEIVLAALHQGGASTYTEAYLLGKTAPWSSLEMVSIGGHIHFYIWVSEKKFKDIVEAQIYAQYPTVEVFEVPLDKDYTRQVDIDEFEKKGAMWGMEFKLSDKDVYPIKTYVDYGLDKDQKEEFRIDPMTAVLEYVGSVKPGHQVWYQIMIKKHEKEGKKALRLHEKPDWKAEAVAEIEEIRKRTTPTFTDDEGNERSGFPNPTKGDIEKIAAIERSVQKWAFDTNIRALYLAEDAANFNPVYISGMLGSMRQYSSANLNGLKLSMKTDVSDEMKDMLTIFPFLNSYIEYSKKSMKKVFLLQYRLRTFFQPWFRLNAYKANILTTEELATLYHFPSNVAATPTLPRIASKKSEAPANLPIKE